MEYRNLQPGKSIMPRIINVRCNGLGSHENEIDIDKLFTPCFVVRPDAPVPGMDRRRVLDCAHCREGKVVVTPDMVREALGYSSE
jgi:Asp-tRNA(Asn)/Glu-tRNA(Gln) amidotransferase C subunit